MTKFKLFLAAILIAMVLTMVAAVIPQYYGAGETVVYFDYHNGYENIPSKDTWYNSDYIAVFPHLARTSDVVAIATYTLFGTDDDCYQGGSLRICLEGVGCSTSSSDHVAPDRSSGNYGTATVTWVFENVGAGGYTMRIQKYLQVSCDKDTRFYYPKLTVLVVGQ